MKNFAITIFVLIAIYYFRLNHELKKDLVKEQLVNDSINRILGKEHKRYTIDSMRIANYVLKRVGINRDMAIVKKRLKEINGKDVGL